MSWTNIFAVVTLGSSKLGGAAAAIARKAGAGALAGGVIGESRVLGHVGEIEVLRFQWGMRGEVQTREKVLARKGRANANPDQLLIVKRFDTASPALLNALRTRQEVSELKLTVVRNAQSFASQMAHAGVERGEDALGGRGGKAAAAAEAVANSVALAQAAYSFRISGGFVKRVELTVEPVDQGVELREHVYFSVRELKVEYHPVSRQGQRTGAVTFHGHFEAKDAR